MPRTSGPAPAMDPFARFLAPPLNESQPEKINRLKKEADAQRESDRIDEELKVERSNFKKQQRTVVKVLLLGQAESGKSTTLKNFRLQYAYDAWVRERAAWRAVIRLNLIISILKILDTLDAEMSGDLDLDCSLNSLYIDYHDVQLTEKHHILKRRLGPLRSVHAELRRVLGASADEDSPNQTHRTSDFQVSFRTWQDLLEGRGTCGQKFDDPATGVILSCRDNMISLWTDPVIRKLLKKHHVFLENSAGFFLNDLDRIASADYEPSDDDVVRARLRTLGIQEHRLRISRNEPEWIIYDVGGSRTMRKAWLPYFDDVNAVIFLAPISAFDERLREDPKVNRLEDSVGLWIILCKSKLLARASLVAFLNKCDILNRKLKNGIQLNQHIPGYADRPNDIGEAVRYFRDKFKGIHQAAGRRSGTGSYIYPTAVTDTKATAVTLLSVKDGIAREIFRTADLL